MNQAVINISGMKFGRWTVIRFSRIQQRFAMWDCLCECGVRRAVRGRDLRNGASKSCGCRSTDYKRQHPRILHGRTNTVEHTAWLAIKGRCTNPRNVSWRHYGGRGITVCSRWLDSFENFLADMGPRPLGMSIDRINNSGNYEPGNCRWATIQQQARNRRDNVLITIGSKTQLMSEWLKESGIKPSTATMRIRHYGWNPEDAVTVPAQKRRSL